MTRIEGFSWRAIGRRNSDHPLLPALLLGGVLVAAAVAAYLLPGPISGPAAPLVAVVCLGAGYIAWPKPGLVAFALLMVVSPTLGRWITPEIVRLDDIAMPALVVLALARTRPWRRRLFRPVRDGALAIALAFGVVSALAAGVPTGTWVLALLLLGKVFAFLYVVEWHDFSERDIRQLAPTVLALAVLVLAVGALEAVAPMAVRQALNLGAVGTVREGLPSIKSILHHPTLFAWFATFVALFLFAAHTLYRRWWMLLGALAFSLATFLSARRLALAGLAAALVAGVVAKLGGTRDVAASVRRWAPAALGTGALVIVFAPALLGMIRATVSEASDADTARVAMVTASVAIARDHFPLGVGLGRFGSAPSRDPYSPVYVEYGLDDVRGLSPDSPTSVKDAFWARVMGELGLIGFAALVTFTVALGLAIWRAVRRPYSTAIVTAFMLGAWMAMVHTSLDSLASTMFESPPRAYLFFGAMGAALALARSEPAPIDQQTADDPRVSR